MTDNHYSKQDLRTYLEFVEEKGRGHFLEIDKEISPRWTTTAVVRGLARKLRNPVIRFSHVEGSEYPVVTNICASLDRVAKSIGCSVDQLNERFVNAMNNAIEAHCLPRANAPAYETTRMAANFSLRELPALIYTDTQTNPYITGAIVVGRDPESGAHNLSFHRFMISSDHTAAIYMTPGGHLHQIWKKNCAAGRPTPLAIVIGTHPLWCFASLIAGALDSDDYSIVGAVLGEALALTPSIIDSKLLVPALAEIILEGVIDPEQTETEGPFGEFLGYVAETAPQPIVRFSSLSSRRHPLYQDIVAGQTEHLTMSSISLRARLQRDYFQTTPAVTDFWLPAAMTMFLSIDTSNHKDFDAQVMMETLLTNEAYLKQVYCFDSDIDLRKQASVQTAIACFVQPDRDIQIYRDRDGNGVDPSERDGKTSKMAIDARAKREAVRSELPHEMSETFNLNDWIR